MADSSSLKTAVHSGYEGCRWLSVAGMGGRRAHCTVGMHCSATEDCTGLTKECTNQKLHVLVQSLHCCVTAGVYAHNCRVLAHGSVVRMQPSLGLSQAPPADLGSSAPTACTRDASCGSPS